MNSLLHFFYVATLSLLMTTLIIILPRTAHAITELQLSDVPLFLSETAPPLMMIVLTRNHKMWYEAYNDATDLSGNGIIDIGYKPDSIDYDGYFDSYKCYNYVPGAVSRFEPVAETANKKCTGANTVFWSGDFLNYLTTSRMDVLRKVLYGGLRRLDNVGETVIQPAYIPQDAHTWGKEYRDIATDGYSIEDYTPYALPTGSGTRRHLFAVTTPVSEGLANNDIRMRLRIFPNAGEYRIWNWVAKEAPVAEDKIIDPADNSEDWIGDKVTQIWVRIRVCKAGFLESNCKQYPNGDYKPTGLLHTYGENGSMKFGLLTGSNTKHLSGGVVRRNISTFMDTVTPANGEVDPTTGAYNATVGIVKNIDRLQIINFGHFGGSYRYSEDSCGWLTDNTLTEGRCHAWGNPVGEMMYEGLRYFAGKNSPTPEYTYGGTNSDSFLGLQNSAWIDPYDPAQNERCAKPSMLVISDIYPNYDSDQLPGSAWPGTLSGSTLSGLNVQTEATEIWNAEYGGSKNIMIGQVGALTNNAPTVKTVSSFSNIRGHAPDEPSKKGSFYSASVAKFGKENDLHSASGDQKVTTYTLSFPSPIARIEIPMPNGKNIIIAPYGKTISTAACGGAFAEVNLDPLAFQPTNQIADYNIVNNETNLPNSATGRLSIGDTGTFRVNFENVEQGGNFDMDAIIMYRYTIIANDEIRLTLENTYERSCLWQHLGYVISGTQNDGLYLDVRQMDENVYVPFHLDTIPPGHAELPFSTVATGGRTFSTSTTPSITILKDPLWYAAKWGGYTDGNSSGTPDEMLEWDANSDGNPDNYFFVTNPALIDDQLGALFDTVLSKSSSSSSSAVNSSSLNSDTRLYQAIFNSGDWTGLLLSFPVDPNTGLIITSGSGPNGSEWDAGAVMATQNWDTDRRIFTYLPGVGPTKYRWNDSDIGTSGKTAHRTNPIDSSDDGDAIGQQRMNYIRGDRSQEQQNGGNFRDRNAVLGDIINSSPVYVGAPNFPYSTHAWPAGAAENSASENYATFRYRLRARANMIYVGANDGMLHGFDATDGEERMAFIPSDMFSKLNKLTSPSYQHEYFVDASPNIGDHYNPNTTKWETLLVSGLNKGGQSIFAIDVTDPSVFSTEANYVKVGKWEFSDSNDADLGYTFSQPAIVRLANGEWGVIFGNGYNNTESDGATTTSSTGNAVLYIVRARDGALIKKIDTGVGYSADPTLNNRPNGLTTVGVADINGDLIADYVYAGDLFGNVWKFDISGTSTASWSIAFAGQPLFVAKDSTLKRQPITTRMTLGAKKGEPGSLQIFFGTGQYLEAADKDIALSTMQTFYALTDNHSTPITSRTLLLQQSIVSEQSGPGGSVVRVSTDNALGANNRGWYMDLRLSGGANEGERQVTSAILRDGKIIFTTLIPSTNICDFGGNGWLMELNADTGSRLDEPPFDLDGDKEFNNNDKVSYLSNLTNISGLKSSSGIIQTPTILSDGETEYKYSTSTAGTLETTVENPTAGTWGREAWIQVR